MALSFRRGSVSVFTNLNSREDNRYNGLQVGFTTYHTPEGGAEQAKTTYAELGGSSDHLSDPINQVLNIDNTVELTADNLDKPYICEAPEATPAPAAVEPAKETIEVAAV